MKKPSWTTISLWAGSFATLLALVAAYLLPHLGYLWKGLGAVAVVGWGGYVYLSREMLKTTLAKRTTQFGLNAIVMSLLALAAGVAVNLIVNSYDLKFDLTKNQIHSLSDQSVKVVKGLKSEVKLLVFGYPDKASEFNYVMGKYTYHSKLLKYRFIDVDREPLEAEKYHVKLANTIIVDGGGRTSRVENLMNGAADPKIEERVTNALIQVAKGDKKKIYFVTGHGERLTSDSAETGFSEAREMLEASRYKVEELALLEKAKVPEDGELVVVAGPKSVFLDHELRALDQYLQSGGKVLFMVEPESSPNLKPFLAKYGAEWNPKKLILENNPFAQRIGGGPVTPIVNRYDSGHEITRDLGPQKPTIYLISSPVEKAKTAPKGLTVTSLFSTTEHSLEIDFKPNAKLNDKTARRGPFSLAVAVEGKWPAPEKAAASTKKDSKDAKEAIAEGKDDKNKALRLVVVGDADFASNAVVRNATNATIFQNMLSWLAQEPDMIAIRPKANDLSEFDITEERLRVIQLASVVLAPLMLLVSGVVVWRSRRRR